MIEKIEGKICLDWQICTFLGQLQGAKIANQKSIWLQLANSGQELLQLSAFSPHGGTRCANNYPYIAAMGKFNGLLNFLHGPRSFWLKYLSCQINYIRSIAAGSL